MRRSISTEELLALGVEIVGLPCVEFDATRDCAYLRRSKPGYRKACRKLRRAGRKGWARLPPVENRLTRIWTKYRDELVADLLQVLVEGEKRRSA